MFQNFKCSIIIYIVICSIINRSDAAESCYVGKQGGAVSTKDNGNLVASAASSLPATTLAAYYTTSCDTCKRTTATSTGFASFPVIIGYCVVAASDADCTSTKCTSSTGTLASGCTQTATSSTTTTVTYCKTAGSSGSSSVTTAPALTSCYTGWSATTLTGTKTSGTGEFCKSTYTVGSPSSTATAVTLDGITSSCETSPTVACCSVNDCNTVLYCYVGTYTVSTGATNIAKTICMPTAGHFCKNSYTYSSGVITQVQGSCEDSCTAIPFTSGATSSNTCCSTSLCNSSESLKTSMIVQLFFLLSCLMMMKNMF